MICLVFFNIRLLICLVFFNVRLLISLVFFNVRLLVCLAFFNVRHLVFFGVLQCTTFWFFSGRNRNTRTLDFFKINTTSKVVLAKIPGHFLVGDRRPPIIYARLHRCCSSLRYDLFQSKIITDSRCVCGFTREDASHFPLEWPLIYRQFS